MGSSFQKSSLTEMKSFGLTFLAIAAMVLCLQSTSSSACTIFDDTDFFGGDLMTPVLYGISAPLHFIAESVEECQAVCQAMKICRAFTMKKWQGGSCYLKKVHGWQSNPNGNSISGLC